MPLYEYECEACGHRFEKIQKYSDPLQDTCPKCGGPVHKLMSSPAIQFKGSGFYITDYAKKDHVASAKADGATAEKGEKAEKAEKSESTGKTSETTEKKSDTPARTEPAAAAAKDTKST
jgi:putative FmdB family regulatory protein